MWGVRVAVAVCGGGEGGCGCGRGVDWWVGRYVCNLSCTPAYTLCCLFAITAETEKIGRVHTELSQKIVEEIDRSVKEFRTQQKEIRKRVGWSAWLL